MNIENIVSDYNARLEEMQTALTTTIREAFKEIFNQAPNLYMICWNQYAPYFNDGDPCEFGVNEMYAVHKDYVDSENFEEFSSPYSFEDEEDSIFRMDNPTWGDEAIARYASFNKEEKKEIETINKFLNDISQIPDDVFKAAFGDDNTVYVFADRIVTEEYGDHD